VTSISDGMAIGLMVYVAAMLLLARWREVHWMSYLLALCFAAYFFVR